MIKCKINGNLITISGHADYDYYGHDIVCASVSSIVLTIVNSIMNLDKNAIFYEDDGEKIIIKKIKSTDVIDTLINTMIELLKDLESKYKKNIKVESEEKKC